MKKLKGFTLIEMSISLLIGSIVLQTLLGFYLQIYKESQLFHEQVYLRNEAYNIENYLRLYIRQAEKIKVITTEGHVIEPLSEENDVIEESLASITIFREVQNEKKDITLILEPNGPEEKKWGEKKLYYYGNANIISYQIKDIKVTSFKDRNELIFTGSVHLKGEGKPKEYTFTFTESIAHKKAYK